MKKNRILFAALASAMLVGCTDQDFAVVENGNVEGLEGKLVEAGLFSVTRSEGDETRAYTSNGRFLWMPTYVDATGKLGDDPTIPEEYRKNQRVGFSWTGRNLKEPDYSPVKELGSAVYTNYEYEHVGWLDQLADQPSDLLCYEGQLMNGAYIVGEGTPKAEFGATPLTVFHNEYVYSEATDKVFGKYTKTDHPQSSGDLNLAKGIFRTNNASVFEGEYLVYYPYTDAFTKGEIVAEMPTTYAIEVDQDVLSDGKYVQNRYAAASETSFAIGRVEHYDGGNTAASFKAYTVNGFAVVRLSNWDNVGGADVNIKRVMLYSENQGILYSQKLDASKCVTALASGSLTGKDLYHGVGDKTNVIYADLDNTSADGYVTVEYKNTTVAPGIDGYVYVALPILPQTLTDLQVIVVNDKDQTLVVNVPAEKSEFKSYGAQTIDINLDGAEFKNEYLVVDEASLWSAWEKIDKTGTDDLTKTNVIKMLKDIRLEGLGDTNTDPTAVSGKGDYNSWFFRWNIDIVSPCGAALTLAAENKMSIKGWNSTTGVPTVKIDVPVTVEGAGCCAKAPAALVVGTGSGKDGKVVFNKDVTNYGTLALNNNLTDAQTVEINGILTNAFDDGIDKNANATAKNGAAEVYMLGGKNANLTINQFDNKNGKAIVAANSINLVELFTNEQLPAVLDPQAPLTERQANVAITTLNNDALIDINKYAIVSVSTSFKNTEDAILLTQGEKKSDTDGRIDVAAATSENVGVIDNQGVANFTKVSLTNTGLFIDRQSGQVGGKMIYNGESETGAEKKYNGMTYKTDIKNAGIYVAQVETTDRMKKILGDKVIEPSTNIVEILGCDDYFFNMYEYEDEMADKDVIINSANIVFKSYDAAAADKAAQLRRIGHCITVLKGNTLKMMDGRLVVANNVIVEEGATAIVAAKNQSDKSNLIVQGNVSNSGSFTNNADYFEVVKDYTNEIKTSVFKSTTAFKVKGNVVNNGEFTSKDKFEVGVNVTNAGTFTSEGDGNTVGGNFTQTAGDSSFAPKTTTTVNGTFSCVAGTFERLTVGGDEHRATVNVNDLGELTGTTSTAWPTEF